MFPIPSLEITPVCLGPTWQRALASNEFVLPERTLGYQIIDWITVWLRGDDGQPFNPTPEQRRFILWWYAVDERGRFVYRRGVLQRLKGWGLLR